MEEYTEQCISLEEKSPGKPKRIQVEISKNGVNELQKPKMKNTDRQTKFEVCCKDKGVVSDLKTVLKEWVS